MAGRCKRTLPQPRPLNLHQWAWNGGHLVGTKETWIESEAFCSESRKGRDRMSRRAYVWCPKSYRNVLVRLGYADSYTTIPAFRMIRGDVQQGEEYERKVWGFVTDVQGRFVFIETNQSPEE